MIPDLRGDSPEETYRRIRTRQSIHTTELMPTGLLDVSKPSDLAANNRTMQQLIAQYWDTVIERKRKK